jgi:hypothetical protein
MNDRFRFEERGTYEIKVKGHFDDSWTHWFEDMAITCQEDGTSLLKGFVPDQSALYSLIIKIHNLGITLNSINRIPEHQEETNECH